MTPGSRRWGLQALRGLSLLVSLGFVLCFLAIALMRADYPFEIEWMEGGSTGHVERIAAGEALYGKPRLAFTPFIYTPLYFQVGALLAPAFGTGFTPLRVVSALSALGCCVLIAAFVWSEARDATAAILAAGIFAATFRLSGAWFDIARVDSMFLFLTLASLFVLRTGRGWQAGVVAGALGAAAFFTKQTALPILGLFALFSLFAPRAKWLAFSVVMFGLVAGISWILEAASDGWYSYYVFELPRQHRPRWSKIVPYFERETLRRLPFVVAGAVAYFLLDRGSPSRADPEPVRRRAFYAVLLVGCVGASLASRIHSGGFVNVLMPGHAALAIVSGLGAAALFARSASGRSQTLAVVTLLACLLQFAMLRYDPQREIPSAVDRAAGERLLETIRGFDGEVLVPFHGYLAARAGKSRSGQWMAIADVLRGEEGEIAGELEMEIRESILMRRYAAIIVDRDDWYPKELASSYEFRGELFSDPSVFQPKTGSRLRPDRLFVPRPAP